MTAEDGDYFEVDQTATVEEGCDVGHGTRIWHYAHVRAGAVIGENCTLGQGVHVGPNVVIGDGCKIQNGAQLFDGVVLGKDVFIGPHVVFTNVLTPRAFVTRRDEFKPTHVRNGASIGANATILCGVTISEYALIGAGSVVTKDVAAHSIVVGNPAQHTRWACQCGETLDVAGTVGARVSVYVCPACAGCYRPTESGTIERVAEVRDAPQG